MRGIEKLALAKPSLANRILWMDEQAPGVFWVNEVWRDIETQHLYWDRWVTWSNAVKRYGSKAKAIAAGFEEAPLAAYPGTSMHGWMEGGRPQARAVDLGCEAKNNALRARLVKSAGGCTPVRGEPWHVQELAGSSFIMPGSPKLVIPKISIEEDDMPRYTDQFRWPDGGQVQVFANGNVECYGSAKFWYSLNDLRKEARLSVKEIHAVGPIDPKDSQAGYVLYDQSNNPYHLWKGTPADALAPGVVKK